MAEVAPDPQGSGIDPSSAKESAMDTESLQGSQYELRFQSLFAPGRGFAFPCDAEGRVDLDALSLESRNNYLYARALVGREFLAPAVQMSSC